MDNFLRVTLIALTGLALVELELAFDLTQIYNATGKDVVEAVVNIIRESCLFANDRLFLRRLAYVESQDGTAPYTFRDGYYGGIWQVDENEFRQTQNNRALWSEYYVMRNALDIDWSNVKWQELRKPLYSGIAAALYTKLKANGSLSWKAEEQGNFWAINFHGGRPASNFTQLAHILDLGCQTTQMVDLVFVLDTSSSVIYDEFIKARSFITQVVDGFMISPMQTQVALVTYSVTAKVQFDLNDYSSKVAVQNAIQSIPRVTGGTNTDLGINTALYQVFTTANGARQGVVKVMVVITDGNSDDDINTRHAADRAHAQGVVTLSVGVGNNTSIGITELNTIATDPDCTHAYTVPTYDDIKFVKEEIQRAICIAPVYINTTYSCEISTCPPLAVLTGRNGTTIENNITCGGMNVYSSTNNPNPTAAQYEYMEVSKPHQKTLTYFSLSNKTLFINLKDNQGHSPYFNGSAGCIATITLYNGDKTDNEKSNFRDPCTHENISAGKLRFPHPYQNNKFLMCDLAGELYVVICPLGEIFVADCSQCIGENTTAANCNKGLTTGISNPCTRENIMDGKHFFVFPGDYTRYIYCDNWGHPWEQQCPAGLEWDQALLTCITPLQYNPCRHLQVDTPYYYPHNCDPHQYIHCDTNEQPFTKSCQLDFVFYSGSQACVPPGSYPGTENLINTCYGVSTPYAITLPVVGSSGYYGVTSDPTQSHVFSNQLYVEPCTLANIQANNLHFAYRYNKHNYIECDPYGHAYLKDCYPGFFDPASQTCADRLFGVNIVG